jgi:hypothetical protein
MNGIVNVLLPLLPPFHPFSHPAQLFTLHAPLFMPVRQIVYGR